MPLTQRPTQCLAACGVYGEPSDNEIAVLDLADEYREELCRIYHERYRDTVNLRNTQFPELFAALVEEGRCYALIRETDRAIKDHHTEVGDRNAVTPALAARLETARNDLVAAATEVTLQRQRYNNMLRAFREHLRHVTNWKNVKSLLRRRAAYAAIEWPPELAAYAAIWIASDLAIRELGERFQERGLHYATRGEIAIASRPKIKEDGPGMVYNYYNPPRPKPWEKLILQFGGGGLTVEKALEEDGCRSFRLTPVYTNHLPDADETLYDVQQQIGTSEHPRTVYYRVKLHRELPRTAILQRWSLVVRRDGRSATPVVSGMDFCKPTGSGALRYDLTWTVCGAGVRVGTFLGEHVRETLVLPAWLVDKRMRFKDEQRSCDVAANEFLAMRGANPPPVSGARQGVVALEQFVADYPQDGEAAESLYQSQRRLRRARRESTAALLCIESIYKTIVRRVCRLHDSVVVDPINLKRVKRYKSRDLLEVDPLPARSREILHAVAPGKLQALLKGYGLREVPSGATPNPQPPDARETDLFTTYVRSLGVKTGTRPNRPNRRSQLRPPSAAA